MDILSRLYCEFRCLDRGGGARLPVTTSDTPSGLLLRGGFFVYVMRTGNLRANRTG